MKKDILTIIEKMLLKIGLYLGMDMQTLGRKRTLDIGYKAWDYVRYSSLELVAEEINHKGLSGNIAELGVFQGDFASQLNIVFPNRKLYLFDTFDGFSSKDTAIEKDKKYSTGEQDFTNTSVERVLQKMTHKENVIIKKGYFPDTTEGIDDSFVFVSLDPDLYKPIYDGLTYFYPRLVQGGYIFVHDYNNSSYKGAKEAVQQFCAENNIPYFPLSDNWGTAVIMK